MKKNLFQIGISILFIGILISQFDFSVSLKDIQRFIKPAYIFMAFIVYACSYIIKAQRLFILVKLNAPLKIYFAITSLHNLWNNILPSRIGELSYVLLIKKHLGLSAGAGLSHLFIMRYLELFISLIILFIAVLLNKNPSHPIYYNRYYLSCILLLIFLMGLLFLIFKKPSKKILLRMISFIGIKKDLLINIIEDFFNIFNQFYLKFILLLSVYTVVGTFILYLTNHILFIMFGFPFSFYDTIIVSSFMILTFLFPLQGIGGFGTYESVLTLGFYILGIQKDVAIICALILHIIGYVYFLLLGLLGYILLMQKK